MGAEIDFEREGLLEGLETDAEREGRLDLLRRLADAGVALDELKDAVAHNRLAMLPLELVYTADCTHTPREMAEELGFDLDFVARNYLALGIAVPDMDDRALNDDDMEAWRAIRALFDSGLPEEEVLDFARLSGRSGAQIAEEALETFFRRFIRPGDTERDFGLRHAELAERLKPVIGPLMETPVRLHLRQLVRGEVIDRTALATGELPDTRRIAVSFADLVDYTGVSERSATAELKRIPTRLEQLAAETAEPPVRLIKLIGDAAMLVSPEVAPLVAATRDLVRTAERDDVLPEMRAGVALGEALHRGGDWYGPTVNVASRLADVAEAGAVLATAEVARAAADGLRWKAAGAKRLKGVQAAVETYRLGGGA